MNSHLKEQLDACFNAKSIAIVGVSASRGFPWILNFTNLGYQGKIFPINPKRDSFMDIPFYKSIKDIPKGETIDYAIIALPAKDVPSIIPDLMNRQCKVALVWTAGFSESNTEEGIKLEKEIYEIIKKADFKMRLIGPNCFGIYVPENKIGFRRDFSPKTGDISFISQSGGIAINMVFKLMSLDLGLSKVISFGNQVDLKFQDFLEYLATDEKTKVIGGYLEGIRGERFLEILNETNKKKPIVIWRGGVSERGAKAILSHTGSIAGNNKIWNSVEKQSQIIIVKSFWELIDQIVAFKYIDHEKIPNIKKTVAIVTVSGGIGVHLTDVCEQEGFTIPQFSSETIQGIKNEMKSLAGVNLNNPLDLAFDFFNFKAINMVLKTLTNDKNTDSVIFHIDNSYTRVKSPLHGQPKDIDIAAIFYKNTIEGLREIKSKKPILIVLPPISHEKEWVDDRNLYLKDFPVFQDIRSAARALAKVIDYSKFRKSIKK